MSTLKVGDTKEFPVGENKLVIEPLPLGRLKKIIKIIAEVGAKVDQKVIKDDFLTVVPGIVEGYIDQIVPLLFADDKHPFMTKEWIDDHLTIPLMKEMFLAAITVNGLGDFFLKTAKGTAPKAAAVPSGNQTTETSSGNSGSTTSSASPTDGGQETSMS